MSRHARPSRPQRLGLMLIGALLAFLCLEVVLRVWDGVPEANNPLGGFHDSDPYLGWRGRPYARLRYHRPDFDTLVQLDADGWRQPDPPPPAGAARRVLVLGDSFTWGWGVNQGEVFTDRLQARLAPAVAIDNRGLSGFGTVQEYLVLQRALGATRYDTVVLMFFLNDVADNTDGKEGRRPYFELVDGRLQRHNQPAMPLMSPLQRFLTDHSRAYQFVDFEYGLLKRRLAGEANDERGYRTAAGVDFHDLPGYAVTARLLEEMHRLVNAHGARFFVVYIPQRSEVELDAPFPYPRAVHAMVEDITRRAGIPLVDLTPPLRAAARRGAALIFPVDAHWTAAGHRLAADVLLSSPIFQPGGDPAASDQVATSGTAPAAALAPRAE